MANSIAKQPSFSLRINSDSWQKMIRTTLGDPQRARQFTAAIVSAVSINKELQDCETGSVLSGALLGETLNLTPSPQLGQYYLVPFNDKKAGTKKAQFILGYKGYIQLAIRSGNYRTINAVALKDGELKSWNPITEEFLVEMIEDEELRVKANTSHYLAFLKSNNGFTKTMCWTAEKMLSHADRYSPAFSAEKYKELKAGKIKKSEEWKYSSFWYKDFDSMALKTMLRQIISRWGEMSIDMQRAVAMDEKAVDLSMNGNEPVFTIADEENTVQGQIEPETLNVSESDDLPFDTSDEIDLSEFET